MQTIKVKEKKYAASIELENGDVHKIISPSFELLKEFDELRKADDSESIFKAYEKLGLPIAVGRALPMSVLQEIAESIAGKAAEKK